MAALLSSIWILSYFLPLSFISPNIPDHFVVVVDQLCLALCDPMDCSMPGFPVLYHLLELGDAIQLSQVLSSPSPPAYNLSQHQGLF